MTTRQRKCKSCGHERVEATCDATPRPKWYAPKPLQCWYEGKHEWHGLHLCGTHYRMVLKREENGQPLDEIEKLIGVR